MNFTLTITASPELLAVLQGIAGLAQKSITTPKEKKQVTVMSLPDTPAPAGEPAPSANGDGGEERITIEQIRAEAQGKTKDHRDEIKKIFESYGAKNLTVLDSKHYAGAYEKIKAL